MKSRVELCKLCAAGGWIVYLLEVHIGAHVAERSVRFKKVVVKKLIFLCQGLSVLV